MASELGPRGGPSSWWRIRPRAGVAVGLAVGGEKVIDQVRAVVVCDGANPGHPGEGEWPDELTDRQFPVAMCEFGLRSRAGEYGVKRLSVLVNDSGP